MTMTSDIRERFKAEKKISTGRRCGSATGGWPVANLCWHFLRVIDGVPTLGNNAGPAPDVGEWLTVDGPLTICHRGLHASWRAIDALDFVSWEGAAATVLVEVEEHRG